MQIILKRTNAGDPVLRELILLLDKELRHRNGDATQDVMDLFNIVDESFRVVIAYDGDKAIGCGCFKEFDTNTVEIKRMFVLPGYRGKGAAAAILSGLESWADELGYQKSVLETGTRLQEAVKLYRRMGYAVRAQYGQYIDVADSVCMEKALQ